MKKLVGLVRAMLLVAPILFSKGLAKDLGTFGAIYQINEKDMLEEIKAHINQLEQQGKLNKLKENIIAQVKDSLTNFVAIEGISPTKKPRSWLFDPSITIGQDIVDDHGIFIAKAGSKLNPLSYINLNNRLIFIQGNDLAQLDWAITKYNQYDKKVKIILTSGNPIALMQKFKIPFYFDQDGIISNHFGLKQNPALIEQHDLMLQISEIEL